jgi:Na+-transporting methylmalonyl-CoA/oxaloacetate decarboxylase gamma subunit
MLLVAIAWMYVVLMMALAEAFSTQGSVLGALMTFVLYGVVPLAIVMYLMGTPMRRKARRRAEALQANAEAETSAPISAQPDDGGHAAAAQSVDALVTERKEA